MAVQTTKGRPSATQPQRRKIAQATLDALMEQLGEPDASTMDDGVLADPADSHTHIHIHGIGSTAPGGTTGVKDEEPAGGTQGNGSTVDPNVEARFVSLENGHKEIIAQLAALTKAISGEGGSGGEDPSGDPEEEDDPEKVKDENPFATKKEDDPEEKKDPKAKTSDSAALETSYKGTLAGCEVLVPGFRVPTFDAKAKRSTTIDAMCNARRKALDAFSATTEGQQIIESVSGVKTIDTIALGCTQVATLFQAAVGAKKLLNNGAATRDANRMAQPNAVAKKGPTSLADLNKTYREFYAAKH
jgi:hypothetical protein